MTSIKLLVAGLLCVAANNSIAQPVGTKAPPATATLPTMPLQLATPTDQEVTKLRYELAKVKSDFAEEIVKVRAELKAQAESQKTLASNYEGHTHKIRHTSFDMVPTKAKCFDSTICKNDIFYDKLFPNGATVDASKPLKFTNAGGLWAF
ncbi:MAG: hypothetical protein ABL931_08465 [Usitatibacteraceae bacterium]